MNKLIYALSLLSLLTFSSCQEEDEQPCDPAKEQALAEREAELDRREAELLARERALGMNYDGGGSVAQGSQGNGATGTAGASAGIRSNNRYSGKNRYANVPEDGRSVAYKQARYLPGQFPEASERLLTTADIEHETAWGKKVMLNEIYARHGLNFSDADLRRHFNGESWYKGGKKNVDKMLSDVEKQNIEFLKKNM